MRRFLEMVQGKPSACLFKVSYEAQVSDALYLTCFAWYPLTEYVSRTLPEFPQRLEPTSSDQFWTAVKAKSSRVSDRVLCRDFRSTAAPATSTPTFFSLIVKPEVFETRAVVDAVDH